MGGEEDEHPEWMNDDFVGETPAPMLRPAVAEIVPPVPPRAATAEVARLHAPKRRVAKPRGANSAWETRVKGLLKAELKRRNISYKQLADALGAIGVQESEPNIRNKLARGKFTAVFLLQCLSAIGATRLSLELD